MSNTVEKLNQAIADFVSQPENRILRPGTGGYSTPFRGSVFGSERASKVEEALENQRASVLFLGSNPNRPESLEHMRAAGEGEGDWPDFQRQRDSGYFGHAEPTQDGDVTIWDPIHDPGSAGPGQHFWTVVGEAIEEGLGSLDGVALANVLPWGSEDVGELLKFLRSEEDDLADRVVAFAAQQLRAILGSLRPRLVICPKSVADQSWASGLDIAREQATGLRDVSPGNLAGNRYRMSLGEFESAGSKYPILYINHPSQFRWVASEDRPRVAEAIAATVAEATNQDQ